MALVQGHSVSHDNTSSSHKSIHIGKYNFYFLQTPCILYIQLSKKYNFYKCFKVKDIKGLGLLGWSKIAVIFGIFFLGR